MTALIAGALIIGIIYWCYKQIKQSNKVTEKRDELNSVKSESEVLNVEQEIALEREHQQDIQNQINQLTDKKQ